MKGIGIVDTSYGRVSGETVNGITVFRSIPYAAPPVGELRWHAPKDHEPWDGVRECTKFGSLAWQLPGFMGTNALEIYDKSEDCLLLNIWTPAQHPDEKLPVLFWIHGGGFAGGVGHESVFDGTALASKGVIVVSLNYRLGIFGFLAHPDLRAEADGNGNFGLLDIIFALKWIKKNIAAFGGDPARITVDGQSAGGMAVSYLLASPLTHGLLSGAIIQSGGPLRRKEQTLEEKEQLGLDIAGQLQCSSIAELRKIEPEILLNCAGGGMRFAPCVDGQILPLNAYTAFSQGKIAQVPIMIGSNANEGLSSLILDFYRADRTEYLDKLKEFCGDRYPQLQELYDVEAENISAVIGGDLDFLNLRLLLSKMYQNHGADLYHYYFSKPLLLKDGTNLGAGHSEEICYVFNTLPVEENIFGNMGKEVNRQTSDYFLAENMEWYWTDFVKNGNPNRPGLAKWCPFRGDGSCMHFEGSAGHPEQELHEKQMEFWMQWI